MRQRLRLVLLLLSWNQANAFTSPARTCINVKSAQLHSSLQEDDDDLDSLPRTLDPSNLPRTLDPSSSLPSTSPALIETIGGGTSTIFDMARRMLIWDDNDNAVQQDKKKEKPLPRWHPHSGISDVNPSFRTKSPIMNNQGYASTIWRNVRKRDKPSLWRHALRTYDRMELASQNSKTSVLRIERSTIHHEGALLACAKLGLWKRAMEIVQQIVVVVVNDEEDDDEGGGGEGITDNMVYSLVKASVRGCKKLKKTGATLEERRAPLDAAHTVLRDLVDGDCIEFPLVARHWNPLAAAYQSLGLMQQAEDLLQTHLADRSIGPEPEKGYETFNVHDVSAKDKASYALLVKGAVSNQDWTHAVEALEDMTEAGLYPSQSHLNGWTQVSEKKSRMAKNWKKKRDEYWLESVR